MATRKILTPSADLPRGDREFSGGKRRQSLGSKRAGQMLAQQMQADGARAEGSAAAPDASADADDEGEALVSSFTSLLRGSGGSSSSSSSGGGDGVGAGALGLGGDVSDLFDSLLGAPEEAAAPERLSNEGFLFVEDEEDEEDEAAAAAADSGSGSGSDVSDDDGETEVIVVVGGARDGAAEGERAPVEEERPSKGSASSLLSKSFSFGVQTWSWMFASEADIEKEASRRGVSLAGCEDKQARIARLLESEGVKATIDDAALEYDPRHPLSPRAAERRRIIEDSLEGAGVRAKRWQYSTEQDLRREAAKRGFSLDGCEDRTHMIVRILGLPETAAQAAAAAAAEARPAPAAPAPAAKAPEAGAAGAGAAKEPRPPAAEEPARKEKEEEKAEGSVVVGESPAPAGCSLGGRAAAAGGPPRGESLAERLLRERREEEAQTFAALRVQRHIQERVMLLRQRRRLELASLDPLREIAEEEGCEAPAARPEAPPLAAGWLLKRRRRSDGSRQWQWRHFSLRGGVLQWSKSSGEGRNPWPSGEFYAKTPQGRPEAPFWKLSRMATFSASRSEDLRRSQGSFELLSSPAPGLLRRLLDEERVRNLDLSGAESEANGGHLAQERFLSAPPAPPPSARASRLSVAGLLLVLPQGVYEHFEDSADWPDGPPNRYHLQLFEEGALRREGGGWALAGRPRLELWAPCYEEYLSWVSVLDRASRGAAAEEGGAGGV